MLTPAKIPLALYIHIPWCVKKCPYCDFNSHEIKGDIDYVRYVDALLADARSQIAFVQGRQISSVFIGGGTPSLLPIEQYQRLFDGLNALFEFTTDIEVTMEANPATIEHAPFEQYLAVGINRLSIGVQTFNSERLQTLGRIHNAKQAQQAVISAKRAGFERVNVDLMHGLPQQSVAEAMYDIEQAMAVGATHLSWYQLTIEPNTVFYRNQPILPDEEVLAEIEQQGTAKLLEHGFTNYEVSAWHGANDDKCRHNVNYWQFGDYLAIGAGAHGKVSVQNMAEITIAGVGLAGQLDDGVYRFYKPRSPKDYVQFDKNIGYPKMLGWRKIEETEIAGEFMLDALRLTDGVASVMFTERTGRQLAEITDKVTELQSKGLLVDSMTQLKTTELGRRYLNQVIESFI